MSSGVVNRGHEASPSDPCYMRAKQSRGYKSYDMDVHFDAVEEAAGDSRVWAKLSAEHRQILGTYEGPEGQHWERVHAGAFKIGSIYHLTPTGKLVTGRFSGAIRPTELIERMVRDREARILAKEEPDPRELAELSDMDAEAWSMLFDAQDAEKAAKRELGL